MSKQAQRQQKRTSRRGDREDTNVVDINPTNSRYDKGVGKIVQKFVPKTKAQANYLQLIDSKQLVFGDGPAGTGKTYVAVSRAAERFIANRINKIVITRPAVEAEEELGFLPGTEGEKCAPYFAPIREILLRYFGASHLDLLIKREDIVFKPMAYMRGTTFENAFVILDEAQNTTPKQMKLFLTRIGENTTVVINGDTDQVDIQGRSGLADALDLMREMPDTGHYTFGEDDIVRSGMCREIVKRYNAQTARRNAYLANLPEPRKLGYWKRLWRALLGAA